MTSEHSILFNKRARMLRVHEGYEKEIKNLRAKEHSLHGELQRLNGLISKNAELAKALENDAFNLEK